MSTRSRIGILNESGSVISVYCHFDGYIEGVGTRLKQYYNTEDRVRNLLSYGDMSSLGETTNKTIFYDREFKKMNIKNNCFPTIASSIQVFKKSNENYYYLFQNNEWAVLVNDKFINY